MNVRPDRETERVRRTKTRGTGGAVAIEWADAVRAWCRDHATNWPAKHGTCPACKGTKCFGRATGDDDPPRWVCFDTDHAGAGREGSDGAWRGDALDLEAHARGKTLAEVLRADRYLTGTRPAGGTRRAPAPPPAKLPPLVLPRPTPVAADAEALAGWRLDGTIFASVREYGNGEPLRVTWAELVELFREPTTLPGAAGDPMDDRKKELHAWNGGRFEGGTSAKRGQSKRASALLLDLDADPTKPAPKCGEPDLTPDKLRAVLADVLPGVAWAAHTSSSSTPGCWRWRVVVPLAEELEAVDYVAVVDLLRLRLLSWSAAPFALEADVNANRGLSRLWYAAARVPERPGDYATAEAAGTLLDGLALLESTAAAVGVKLADLPARLTADCESKRTPAPDPGPDHPPTEAPPMPNQSDDPGWDPDDPGAGGAPDDGCAADAESVAAMGWTTPDAAWLAEEPPRREYLLHDAPGAGFELAGPGMLPRGKVGILAAAGGVGKTYALCGLALAVVTGRPWLGHFPVGERRRGARVVLVLGEEDPAELRRRLHTQARAMGLDASHGPDVARILALPGAGEAGLALTQGEDERKGVRTRFADGLLAHLRAVAERDGPWDAVILDPLSRFAGPDVEKDNSAATRLIQVLEGFTKLPGEPTIIVAHHTSQASRKEGMGELATAAATAVRGATGLTDGSRWVGSLEEMAALPGLPGHAQFRVLKSNYAAFPKSIPRGLMLTREANGGGLRASSREEQAAYAKAIEDAKPEKAASSKASPEEQARKAEDRREESRRKALVDARAKREKALLKAGDDKANKDRANLVYEVEMKAAHDKWGAPLTYTGPDDG